MSSLAKNLEPLFLSLMHFLRQEQEAVYVFTVKVGTGPKSYVVKPISAELPRNSGTVSMAIAELCRIALLCPEFTDRLCTMLIKIGADSTEAMVQQTIGLCFQRFGNGELLKHALNSTQQQLDEGGHLLPGATLLMRVRNLQAIIAYAEEI